MKLPPDVEFLEDLNLLVYRPHGFLNEATMNEVVAYLGQLEASRPEPFNRVFDTLELEELDFDFEYVMRLAIDRRRACAGRPPVKSAIIAVDQKAHFLGRLHVAITEGSSIDARVFHDRKKAAQWLGVPLGRVEGALSSRPAK